VAGRWRTWGLRLATALAFVLSCGLGGGAAAQGIESVLRPGEVIEGHAKVEDDCGQCHVKFDRNAQDRLCADCHKDVGRDVRERTGFHGRQKPQACRNCHTDHKGRGARIVMFDERNFDHTQSDYALRGRHEKVECRKCHEPAKRWREAPHDCNACHRKDDTHKGSLGTKCADCHTENSWKEARFDHEKTRFALTGKHVDAKCADCHKDSRYKETPRTCIGCHRKEDDGAKGHKGRFGIKCESCHGTKAWKPSTFNHDQDTKYPLRFAHGKAKCGDCHTGILFKDKTGSACIDCHRKDDDGAKGHKGSLGRDCGSCHTERGWKETGGRFDHAKSRFPLLGAHRDTECKACHKSTNYKEAPRDCVGCHRKDDKHEGNLGTQCADCHNERKWSETAGRFDHDKTKFKLRNAHAAKTVKCDACHVNLRSFRNTATDCLACHKKDDKHQGQLGPKCEQCHGDRDWKVPAFDHRVTRFPLLGRHVAVKCGDCHATPRYRDAARDCWSCHKKDDKHKLAYGTAFESCHNARGWGLWDFDHDRRSSFALDGAHRKTACAACHTRPAPAGKAIAEVGTSCLACHRKDDTHDGGFGSRCEQCHYTDRWKRVRPRPGADAAPPHMPQRLALGLPGGGRP